MVYWMIAGVVLVVAVIVLLFFKKGRKSSAGEHSAEVYRTLLGQPAVSAAPNTPQSEALRQNLRVKLLYQEDKVDAAIEFERERNPSASRDELMRAAIARWERDNQ